MTLKAFTAGITLFAGILLGAPAVAAPPPVGASAAQVQTAVPCLWPVCILS